MTLLWPDPSSILGLENKTVNRGLNAPLRLAICTKIPSLEKGVNSCSITNIAKKLHLQLR